MGKGRPTYFSRKSELTDRLTLTLIFCIVILSVKFTFSLPIVDDNNYNIYTSFNFTSINSINLTKYNCDPDINIDYRECYMYIKYYIPKPYVENISSIVGAFYTSINYSIYQDYYDSNINAYKQYIVFPAPEGATSCEEFFKDDFMFNL